MNVFNIENAFKLKKERNWKTIYVAVDAHGVLIKPYHDCIEFYPVAIEVMKWFSDRGDFKIILWSSSYHKENFELVFQLATNGVVIDFVNENPAEQNSAKACFDKKFYFNILLDDKAGFDPLTDWALIKQELIRLNEWGRPMYGTIR
jgi:hypothetical protein